MIKTSKIFSVFFLILVTQSLSPLFGQIGNDASGNSTDGLSPWHREMRAVRIIERPNIDGKLDDAVWQNIDYQSDFLAREPFGEPATEKN